MNDIKDLEVKKIDNLPGVSGNNKALYMVVVEDPSIKQKARYYLSHRVDRNDATIEIVGLEIANINSTLTLIKSAKTYDDALEIAKKQESQSEYLIIPWHKILRINKFTFSTK